MGKGWNLLLVFVGLIVVPGILIALFVRFPKKEERKCPANDVVIYTDAEHIPEYTCPVVGQQLTVVREVAWKTYVRCSCPK